MTRIAERVLADERGLARAAGEQLVREVDRCVRRKRPCYLAMSGGANAERLYRHLAAHYRRDILWHLCTVFVLDDEIGPMDSGTAGLLQRTLFHEASGTAPTLHQAPPNAGGTEATAAAYERLIRAVVPAGPAGIPAFDVIVLGLDDHCCPTLYSRAGSASSDDERLVVSCPDTGNPSEPGRLGFALRLINSAECVIILASGAHQAAAYARVRKDFAVSRALAATPAGRIRPTGQAMWFIDQTLSRATVDIAGAPGPS